MKQLTYEIWEAKDGTEKAMFTRERAKKQYNFLTRDTNGRKMILKKTFRSSSIKYARSVYNKFFGF